MHFRCALFFFCVLISFNLCASVILGQSARQKAEKSASPSAQNAEPKSSIVPEPGATETAKASEDKKSEDKTGEEKKAPVCDVNRGLSLVESQIEEVRGALNSPDEVMIYLRAAEQLWAHKEETARKLLTDALDLTEKYFRSPFSGPGEWKRAWAGLENPHFAVLSTIVRLDPKWARELTEKMRSDQSRFALPRLSEDFDPAGHWLGSALAMLPIDPAQAVSLAENSLQHDLSPVFLDFLFALSQKDSQAADRLFMRALGRGQWSSATSLITLAPYAFASTRVVCAGDY